MRGIRKEDLQQLPVQKHPQLLQQSLPNQIPSQNHPEHRLQQAQHQQSSSGRQSISAEDQLLQQTQVIDQIRHEFQNLVGMLELAQVDLELMDQRILRFFEPLKEADVELSTLLMILNLLAHLGRQFEQHQKEFSFLQIEKQAINQENKAYFELQKNLEKQLKNSIKELQKLKEKQELKIQSLEEQTEALVRQISALEEDGRKRQSQIWKLEHEVHSQIHLAQQLQKHNDQKLRDALLAKDLEISVLKIASSSHYQMQLQQQQPAAQKISRESQTTASVKFGLGLDSCSLEKLRVIQRLQSLAAPYLENWLEESSEESCEEYERYQESAKTQQLLLFLGKLESHLLWAQGKFPAEQPPRGRSGNLWLLESQLERVQKLGEEQPSVASELGKLVRLEMVRSGERVRTPEREVEVCVSSATQTEEDALPRRESRLRAESKVLGVEINHLISQEPRGPSLLSREKQQQPRSESSDCPRADPKTPNGPEKTCEQISQEAHSKDQDRSGSSRGDEVRDVVREFPAQLRAQEDTRSNLRIETETPAGLSWQRQTSVGSSVYQHFSSSKILLQSGALQLDFPTSPSPKFIRNTSSESLPSDRSYFQFQGTTPLHSRGAIQIFRQDDVVDRQEYTSAGKQITKFTLKGGIRIKGTQQDNGRSIKGIIYYPDGRILEALISLV